MRGFAALVLLPSLMFPPFASGPAQARDALDWLAREPVTLLDWGMTRLRGDLHDTVDGLSHDLRTEVSRSGVFYRFQDRRIVAYANFVDLPRNRTEEVCKDVYTRLAGALVRGGPQGAGGAAWYLESVFSHDSQGGDRPQDLGDQLADRVVLQVTIGPKPSQAFDDGRRITCTGRLDATPENIALKSEG
ncbi:hypothetical protein Sp245p_17630 (plasmid) [Azospirillum baldaniorum]|uniref:Uncharacterized protein n=1 Tax=Azospirillum baldaniorum TaxID=1064539 RepID=A0A9P1JUH8_9PROT|nr:hypothetical protein [Azospirillum baldaniorum]AWJ91650.1 hypothetical protein Sp245p_17630 [Azospirillum baldaniorum]TWA83485.1 hypothetical protein FBZ85_101230 [Azospirillum brasilense]CCC99984.1 exported protein of unknown function [Azospirillum baldaniorum]